MLSVFHRTFVQAGALEPVSVSAFARRFNPSATAQLVSVAPETPSIPASLKSSVASFCHLHAIEKAR